MKKTIKSSFEGMDDIKQILVNGGIPNELTGDIRIVQRKLGSTKEDIVINTLYWDADQIQDGIINVNIHVPNLKGQKGENPTASDNTQPDLARFEELARMVSGMLDDYHGYDFSLKLRSSGKPENFGTEWMCNVQVDYRHVRMDQ